jgi:hypothetical protein
LRISLSKPVWDLLQHNDAKWYFYIVQEYQEEDTTSRRGTLHGASPQSKKFSWKGDHMTWEIGGMEPRLKRYMAMGCMTIHKCREEDGGEILCYRPYGMHRSNCYMR